MIRLALPDIREEDIARAADVLRSGMLIQGPHVAALEEALVRFTGVGHCAVVSSGTAALHVALLALGIGPGDRVIVPAFTFPATANAVLHTGAEVLLCDVHPGSYVVTPEAIDETIRKHDRPDLRAVMVVHEFGFPAAMVEIAAVARRHGLTLIEDAACALGTVAGGAHVGHYSDVACLSFHPRKAITSGEGGALLTRDSDLVYAARQIRNHGIQSTEGRVEFVLPGLNYRMTDFQAALLAGQLERLPFDLARRRHLARLYRNLLGATDRISLPEHDDGHAWQTFMPVLAQNGCRPTVIRELARRGVEANLGAQALNCLQVYRRRYGLDGPDFPVASRLYENGLALPLHGRLDDADIACICGALQESLLACSA